MTDYLELLLEQADEGGRDAPEEQADWRAGNPAPAERTGGVLCRSSAAGSPAAPCPAAGPGPGRSEAGLSAGAGAAAAGAAPRGIWDGAGTAAGTALPPLGDGPALPRPEAGGTAGEAALSWETGRSGGAQALYRQLVRSRAAAAAPATETALYRGDASERAEGASLSAPLRAAQLDKVFQRDARRYDGGFSLF